MNPNVVETTVLYIDGACSGNPGPGGWAYVLMANDDRSEQNGSEIRTTNNRMELTAAIKGLEATPPGSIVEVRPDSEYVLKGMTQWTKAWIKNGWRTSTKKEVLNRDLWEQLIAVSAQRDVRWRHVRAHVSQARGGDPLNERCDELAKEAARMAQRNGRSR